MDHTPECVTARNKERAAILEWEQRWPSFCRSCGARGSWHDSGDSVAPPDGGPCDDCTGNGVCARCGAPGLTSEERGDDSTGEGPCKACGWNYDDARPRLLEDPCPCERATYE